MEQFGIDTRKWLLSAIRQRKFLLRIDKSHKSKREVEFALGILQNSLAAYTYENSLYMARFIISNTLHIINILPGKGSSSYESKQREFFAIRRKALEIADRFYAESRITNSTFKSTQYEIAL